MERAASSGWVVDRACDSVLSATTCTENGDPHSTVPACHTCSKLSKTVILKGSIFASRTGNFDGMDCDMESISCLEKSLANATTPTGREDLYPFLLIRPILLIA